MIGLPPQIRAKGVGRHNNNSRSSDLLFSILFADDTSVFIEGTNYDNVLDIVNNELERRTIWLKDNKLTANIKKTHYMMFHPTKMKHKLCNMTICGMNVTCTNTQNSLV